MRHIPHHHASSTSPAAYVWYSATRRLTSPVRRLHPCSRIFRQHVVSRLVRTPTCALSTARAAATSRSRRPGSSLSNSPPVATVRASTESASAQYNHAQQHRKRIRAWHVPVVMCTTCHTGAAPGPDGPPRTSTPAPAARAAATASVITSTSPARTCLECRHRQIPARASRTHRQETLDTHRCRPLRRSHVHGTRLQRAHLHARIAIKSNRRTT